MNFYFALILAFITGSWLLDLVIELLNVKSIRTELPEEFQGIYSEEKYQKSQEYLITNTRFGLIQKTFLTFVLILFIFKDGFSHVDMWIRSFSFGPIGSGLFFIGILSLSLKVIQLPFTLYDTFVIEQKYGFNKTTAKLFVLDQIKGLVMGCLLGGLILAVILFLFENWGQNAWVYTWLFVTVFQMLLLFLAPILILPLFNKFSPLPDGPLKEKIQHLAESVHFKMNGVFTMDGSKRSTKANAFFTGFGKFKRIVLFDTLIKNHTDEELLAILAHEIGHYKMKHIHKMMGISLFSTGFLFWAFSKFLYNPEVFVTFHMENISVYGSLLFFSLLYSPLSRILGAVTNAISRKHEYEADAFAVSLFPNIPVFAHALKKLSSDSLSNLHPHVFKVFFEYTHPPVLKRIAALQQLAVRKT